MIYGSERIPHLRPDNRPDLLVREPAPPVREDVQRPVFNRASCISSLSGYYEMYPMHSINMMWEATL